MPKKNKQRRTKRSSRSRARVRPIVYSGKTSFFPNFAAGVVQSISLQPNLLDNAVLANLSDTFQLYRCVHLRVKAFPTVTTSNTAVGYINGISDAGPGNISNVLNLPFNLLTTNGSNVPQSFTVPRNFLVNQNSMKWWRTRTSTAGTPSTDAWENTQGTIYFFPQATIATNAIVYEISYTYELSDPMVIGMTPSPHAPLFSSLPPTRSSSATSQFLFAAPSHLSECPYVGSQLQQAGECRFCRLLSVKEG